MNNNINNYKQFLRNKALCQRRRIPSDQKSSSDGAITRRLADQPIWSERQVVHCYVSIQKEREVETKQCVRWLIDHDHEVWTSYLPRNRVNDGFCKISNDTTFLAGRYDIPLPQEEVEKTCNPGVIIVPCVAVDRHGNRLGYGSGWYDQFLLEHNEALRIGLVYDQCVYSTISSDAYDQQLDMLVTEKQVIYCERKI